MKESNNWFEFAKEDLIVAGASLKEEVYNQVCFHAHQGVEKMLKGYLAVKRCLSPLCRGLAGCGLAGWPVSRLKKGVDPF